MTRHEIINTIGSHYIVSNVENDEFSYPKALKIIGKNYKKFLLKTRKKGEEHKFADIRFESDKLVVLVETKDKFTKKNVNDGLEKLQQYLEYEKQLRNPKKVVAILAATQTNDVWVWQDGSNIIDVGHIDKSEVAIRPMEEYVNLHFGTKNNKIAVIQSTYELNELLHSYSIQERLRGQFVGTCLLALKHGLKYKGLSTPQIRTGIQAVLEKLLNKCLNKAEKLVILKNKVVDAQCVKKLEPEVFEEILDFIGENILPYINEKTTQGQDILNLFFTTFNKYVGKADKNQAFTPDHIVHFMCRVVGINRNSVVLDP
ncbi:MAG: SAM-dependent DNA methyltransferase, partial [Kiritimatiellae bacterium]|nr:SAM-dependent DNA methyltransferase [Kiritimatiellia bacterium]